MLEKLRLSLCDALAKAGAQEQTTGIRDAYRRAYRRIKELPADRKLRKRVWRLDKILCDEVYQGLPPRERAAIDEKVNEALKKVSSAAEDSARAAFIAETRRREIRKRYKLFRLEL